MELAEYQNAVLRTAAMHEDKRLAASILGLGLAGESGEVVELLKKHIGHGHPLDIDKLKKELGDVQWYLTAIAMMFGLSLNEIMETNIEKLKARYPNGFNHADSIRRKED